MSPVSNNTKIVPIVIVTPTPQSKPIMNQLARSAHILSVILVSSFILTSCTSLQEGKLPVTFSQVLDVLEVLDLTEVDDEFQCLAIRKNFCIKRRTLDTE